MFVGIAMTMFAFFGSFARYVAGEAAPVQKDTFNFLAEGTKEGIKTVATAVGQGSAAGVGGNARVSGHCSKCDHANDPDAKFCKNCGTPLDT